jgi:hypothetical protein
MKPRDFLNFFKTKSGRLVAFAALFAGGLIIFSVIRKHHPAPEDAISVAPIGTNAVGGKPQIVQSVTLPMEAFHPPPPKSEPTQAAKQPAYNNSASQSLSGNSTRPSESLAPHQPISRQ